ncbi:MAG: glycosyltransferase [Prevotella sp.]|nr:glycosyltransferase [Prevotella sp.]
MKIWVIGRGYPALNNRMRGSFELEQAIMLAKGGHDVTYLATVFHPYKKVRKWGFSTWEENGIRVCCYSMFYFPERFKIEIHILKSRVLRILLKKVEKDYGTPNIVHVHYPSMITDPDIILSLKNKHTSIVITEHWTKVLRNGLSAYETQCLYKYVKNADACICVGEPLKQKILEILSINREIHVVPNVVDDTFTPNECAIHSSTFTFIAVGRLVRVKQFDKIIEAFAYNFNGDNSYKLLIVGQGEEYKRLKDLIRRFQLESQVKLTGTVSRDNVAKLISSSNCLICYSTLETFGVPIIEAWACGLPVIASECGGLSTTYWNNNLGYIVDHSNIEQLKASMRDIITNYNHFKREKISEFAKKTFSEERVRCMLEEIYSKTLLGRN